MASTITSAQELTPDEPDAELAEAEAPREKRRYIEEVVVTAQKREQVAFDVPMSITAISGKTLEEMGADGAKDIALVTPSFSAFETAPGNQRFQMRGISSQASSTRATVGFYLDDVSLTALPGFQVDAGLYDIQRAEVLRGPQGTLYGEGSMGGTLKLVTTPPDFDGMSFDFRGLHTRTHQGYPGSEAYSAFNLPLIQDKLAARLVLTSAKQGGYITQLVRGVVGANEADKKRARLRVLYQPSDNWTVNGLLIHQDVVSGSLNYADADYVREDLTTPGSDDISDIFNLSVTRTLSFADVLLSYSFADRSGNFVTDGRQVSGSNGRISGNPLIDDQLEMLSLAAVDEAPVMAGIDSSVHVVEVRVTSSGTGGLQWTGGLFFRDAGEATESSLILRSNGVDAASLIEVTQLIDGRQYAVFGQAEYDVRRWLNVAFGLRVFYENGVSDTEGTAVGTDASNFDELEFDSINPRLVASFRGPDDWGGFVNETLAYASISKGFRSGGANVRAGQADTEDNAIFEPDFVWTYEIGGKMIFWDGRLTAESAIFFNDWKNVQLTTNDTGAFLTSNVGNAEAVGIDWNIIWRPVDALTLSFSGNLIDANFVTSTVDKQPGDPLDFVPPKSASLGAAYNFNWTSAMRGLLRMDYNFQDANRYRVRSAGVDAISDPIHMINARLGFELLDWQLYVFGRNLTNFSDIMTSYGEFTDVRLRPVNFGLEVKMSF